MSQSQPRQALPAAAPDPATPPRTELETSAQFLLFEPGLYAIDFSAPRSLQTEFGLRLPAIRIEPVPAPHYPGRAVISFAAEGGWLSGSERPAYVLVVGGQAGAVLTVYRTAGGMPGPEIRIRALGIQDNPAPAPPVAPRTALPPILPIAVLAHIRAVGDVKANAGEWAGRPGSGNPVEGFSLLPGGEIAPGDIEYQARLGHNWDTPWFGGGQFCGSRGLALPLLGLRARLIGSAAERFDLQCWASFAGAGAVGPVSGGELCAAGEAPLEAVRFAILPRPALNRELDPPRPAIRSRKKPPA